MKRVIWIFLLAAVACAGAFAQQADNFVYQRSGAAVAVGQFGKLALAPVTGAPYSATVSTEMVQTLSDGNHITQNSTGTIARDSQGRTRQDAPLPPAIGNLSAANIPHLVFIQDPVAQVSYTLNLTDKTAQKMPTFSVPLAGSSASGATASTGVDGVAIGSGPVTLGDGGPGTAMQTFALRAVGDPAMAPPLPVTPDAGVMVVQKSMIAGNDPANTTTEDLGSQTLEGVLVNGTRTTRTIPAGQIGNDAPIKIVTEVWTSPDLKTVVYSKRSDPRMGEQTFQLKGIVRSEPDPSLFFVPAGFTITDGPQPIQYRLNP